MAQTNVFEVDKNVLGSILQVYNRTEESLNEDVAILKNWMKQQPHLPEILDETSLRNFLLINKLSIEKTKQRIDMYYTMRSRIPEFYRNIEYERFKMNMDTMYICPGPKLTENNYRVCFVKIRNPAMVHQLDPYELVKMGMCIQEIRLKEDVMFGDIFILDHSGPFGEYLFKHTPLYLAKLYTIYEKVWSIPLKGVYFINSHPFVSTLLTITKALIKPKLFERFHVCQDDSILKETFPKNILPRDYGGDLMSLEEIYELMQQKYKENWDRFVYLSTCEVDESLRPEKLENDEFLGFHGNFKKLNVD